MAEEKPKLTSPVLEALQQEFRTVAEEYKKTLADLEKVTILKLKYEGVLEYTEKKAKAEMERLQQEEAKKNKPTEPAPTA